MSHVFVRSPALACLVGFLASRQACVHPFTLTVIR